MLTGIKALLACVLLLSVGISAFTVHKREPRAHNTPNNFDQLLYDGIFNNSALQNDILNSTNVTLNEGTQPCLVLYSIQEIAILNIGGFQLRNCESISGDDIQAYFATQDSEQFQQNFTSKIDSCSQKSNSKKIYDCYTDVIDHAFKEISYYGSGSYEKKRHCIRSELRTIVGQLNEAEERLNICMVETNPWSPWNPRPTSPPSNSSNTTWSPWTTPSWNNTANSTWRPWTTPSWNSTWQPWTTPPAWNNSTPSNSTNTTWSPWTTPSLNTTWQPWTTPPAWNNSTPSNSTNTTSSPWSTPSWNNTSNSTGRPWTTPSLNSTWQPWTTPPAWNNSTPSNSTNSTESPWTTPSWNSTTSSTGRPTFPSWNRTTTLNTTVVPIISTTTVIPPKQESFLCRYLGIFC